MSISSSFEEMLRVVSWMMMSYAFIKLRSCTLTVLQTPRTSSKYYGHHRWRHVTEFYSISVQLILAVHVCAHCMSTTWFGMSSILHSGISRTVTSSPYTSPLLGKALSLRPNVTSKVMRLQKEREEFSSTPLAAKRMERKTQLLLLREVGAELHGDHMMNLKVNQNIDLRRTKILPWCKLPPPLEDWILRWTSRSIP